VSLSGVLLDDQERRIAFDNFNTVDFKIDRIYVFSGSTNELNRRLVYDRYSFNPFLSNTNIIARYVNFQNASVRAQQGIAGYAFSTLSTDCDVVISASVSPLDKDDEPLGLVRSDPLTIAIRGDRLRAVASVREDADSSYIPSSTIVAGNPYDLHFTLAHLDRNNLPLNHNTPYHLSVSDSISHESFFS
jgi:hypothetical protein